MFRKGQYLQHHKKVNKSSSIDIKYFNYDILEAVNLAT